MTKNDPDSRPCPRPVESAFGSPVALRGFQNVGWSCAVRNQVRSCPRFGCLLIVRCDTRIRSWGHADMGLHDVGTR